MIQRIMLLATVSLLAACGPGRIEKPNTNLSTLIEIVYLDTGNNTINFRLSHRQADTRAPSTLECRLRINDGVYQALPSLQIPELTAYARERFSWGLPKDHSIPIKDRIEYTLDCSLKSKESRDEYFKSRGALYRLGEQEPPVYR
ncbi:MAG: hypothetical protein OQK49_01100 [Proteobacteria bacterium]|nr:hypothetical protein [Pseudomonadota bacterium]